MRIFANHAHVAPESMNRDGTVARLMRLLDACGIERVVGFAPFPELVDAQDFDPNKWLAAETARNDRLVGFGTIDFRRDDGAAQVKRIKDLGLSGLKLHPNMQHFDILAPRALQVYDAAQEHGLFITFHTGAHQAPLRETNILKFDDVAWQFPNLKFSMEHVGGYHFFDQALAVLFNHVPPPWEKNKTCNVYGGLASVFTTDVNRFWYLSRERLLELVAQVGASQLIFGLDFPFNKEKQTKIAFDTINSLNLSETDKAAILGGNLRHALGMK